MVSEKMYLRQGLVEVLLVGVLLVTTTVQAEDATAAPPVAADAAASPVAAADDANTAEPPKTPPSAVTPKPVENGNKTGQGEEGEGQDSFMDFNEQNDQIDSFLYEKDLTNIEYLIVDEKGSYRQAHEACKLLDGWLAVLDTIEKARFIAEALSETRLFLDTLWIAGKRFNDTVWVWDDDDEHTTLPINESITSKLVYGTNVSANDRDCLAFGRSYHEDPEYRPLVCNGKRNYICQRHPGGGGGNSTHPGWIKLGKRWYKIFYDKINYETADLECTVLDRNSSLAVVANKDDAEQLGRYLLIGRPSLENAWIGAKWHVDTYWFEQEQLELNNEAKDGYPPWRGNHMQKPKGCILLDRHLTNRTLFVEARCTRRRSFICYKTTETVTNKTDSTDVIIGEFGYRLIYTKVPWQVAVNNCINWYGKYGAKLVELRDKQQITNVLYVMGENKTAIQHIWIGGIFLDTERIYQWVSDNATIDTTVLTLMRNYSYSNDVEQGNLCLDMDRENHNYDIEYATICSWEQSFICAFSAEKLKELQRDELQRDEANEAPAPPPPNPTT